MAKTQRLPEFPTDWHQEAYVNDLEREVAGRKNRLAELKALNAHQDLLDQTQVEIDAAKAELLRVLGKGQKAAVKRPRRAAEKRTQAK